MARNKQNIWFVIHHWAGLKLSLFISFIILTGTLAVLSYEIDWLLNDKMRSSYFSIETQARSNPLPLGQLFDNAKDVYPTWNLYLAYAPIEPWFSFHIYAVDTHGKNARVFVDQYSGKVLGDSAYLNVQRFLREVHRNLMLPTNIGIPIVSSVALLLLVLLITGLMSYKKFWKNIFVNPRRINSRVFWGDMHRLLGVWSLWFILLVVITSLWYLTEVLGGNSANYTPRSKPAAFSEHQMSIKEMQQLAEQAFPKLQINEISPSFSGHGVTHFMGQASAILVRDRANIVSVDPNSGQVMATLDAQSLSIHQRISEMADPLHFGTWGGLATRIIWFIFGIILTTIAISGSLIYAKRTKRLYKDLPSATKRYIKGLGFWLWISLVLIIGVFIACPFREY